MRDRRNRRTGEAGVSESIGFLLIFTLVIVGIGLVTLYGYPLLVQQQVSADEQIMEKNMIVLQNDMKSIAYKTVPYKETSLKIGGGALTVYNSSSAHPASAISISDSNLYTYLNSFRSGDLRYSSQSSGTDISLQNGAVVLRKYAEPGSTMLAQPRWFFDAPTNTMVINLIAINSSDVIARSGVGTVQMEQGESNYTYITQNPPITFYLDYTPDPNTDFSNAWDTYFTSTLMMTRASGTPGAGTTVTYRLPFDPNKPATLVIKKYEVIIKSV